MFHRRNRPIRLFPKTQKVMKKVKISLSDLINVFDSASQEERQYLDTETGEIIRIFDEALGGIDDTKLEKKIETGLNVRYFAIPEQDSHEDYKDMSDFTRTIEDKNFQEKLEIALDGSGAFRRFKNVLSNYPQERDRWFAFKNERIKERVLEWLHVSELELVEQ